MTKVLAANWANNGEKQSVSDTGG